MLEISKEIQANIREKAGAIEKYTELIIYIKNNQEISLEQKQYLIKQIEEIIADELDHIDILKDLYSETTNIEPKGE